MNAAERRPWAGLIKRLDRTCHPVYASHAGPVLARSSPRAARRSSGNQMRRVRERAAVRAPSQTDRQLTRAMSKEVEMRRPGVVVVAPLVLVGLVAWAVPVAGQGTAGSAAKTGGAA